MNKNANESRMRYSLKSHITCSVRGCRSRTDGKVSFHHFPKLGTTYVDFPNESGIFVKTDRRRAWERVLKLEREASSWMRICASHFVEDDYCPQNVLTRKKCLKKIAVPSCNLPESFPTRNTRPRERKINYNVDEEWSPKKEVCPGQTPEEEPRLVSIKEEPVDQDEREQVDTEESFAVKTELLEPKLELDEPVNDIPSFTFVKTEVVTDNLRNSQFFDGIASTARSTTLNNLSNIRHC